MLLEGNLSTIHRYGLILARVTWHEACDRYNILEFWGILHMRLYDVIPRKASLFSLPYQY